MCLVDQSLGGPLPQPSASNPPKHLMGIVRDRYRPALHSFGRARYHCQCSRAALGSGSRHTSGPPVTQPKYGPRLQDLRLWQNRVADRIPEPGRLDWNSGLQLASLGSAYRLPRNRRARGKLWLKPFARRPNGLAIGSRESGLLHGVLGRKARLTKRPSSGIRTGLLQRRGSLSV